MNSRFAANDVAPPGINLALDRGLSICVAAGLLIALTAGGATQGAAISTLIVRLSCLPLLVLALTRLPRNPTALLKAAVWLIAALFVAPILQDIPLPPQIWHALPGRQFLVDADRLAGLHDIWRPLSLTPDATLNMLPSLAVPTAFFLATVALDDRGRRIATLAILIGALGAILLGALQVAGGPDSPLRFYAVTNADSAVGFFANRNHQAALLIAAIPFTAYWTLWLIRRGGLAPIATIAVFLGVILILVVGLGVTRSRAGVMLGAVAILGCLALILRARDVPGRRTLFVGFGGSVMLGAGLIALFSLGGLLERFEDVQAGGNSRSAVLPTIVHAASNFWPAGAGFGSFLPVYAMFEPADFVSNFFLNHAHDDYLELWLEGGLLGVILGVAGLAWIGWASFRAWTSRTGSDSDLPRAASIATLMLLMHSAVDYPLRTAAMAAVLAVACGLMVPTRAGVEH